MNPTPDHEPGGRSNARSTPPGYPAILITHTTRRPTHRRRLRSARAQLLATRHARPTTVWPCAEDDRREGAGVISGWLHTAVVKIVTTYTRPGDRVLLLGPPDRASGAQPAASTAAPWPGRYTGLHEAAWTIMRLGRSVQTHTAAEPDWTDAVDPPTFPARVGSDSRAGGASESGPGPEPATDRHSRGPRTAPSPTDSVPPDGMERRRVDTDQDRFKLLITAVYPRATDWLRVTAWTDRLLPNGTLAIVTHSDLIGVRLVDPTPAVVSAVCRAGLVYVDHIALLEIPLRRGRPAASEPAARATDSPDAVPLASSESTSAALRIPIRAHSDLHVFGPVSSAMASDTARAVTPDETMTHTRNSSDV